MDAVEILKSKGLKKTAQRIVLINILQKKNRTLTESDIKTEMGELYDRATFYRTIQALIDATVIYRIVIDNKTIKYTLDGAVSEKKSRSHFFCKKCHSVVCLKNVPVINYNLPKGYKMEESEILINGFCNKCNKTT